MNCKYCNAELPEGETLCPACGKEQELAEETTAEIAEEVVAEVTPVAEETVEEAESEDAAEDGETAKASPKKLSTAIIAIVLVAGILIGLLMGGMGGTGTAGTEPTTAPTTPTVQETEPVVIPSDGNPESSMCKVSYTVSAEDAAAARDRVVAVMENKDLTNSELQAYYWMEVSLFLQEYGSYASYIGLDPYSPLDKQLTQMSEQPMSWQQFFMDSAIHSWKTYQSLALEAENAGYVLPAELQAQLDQLPEELENTAKQQGMTLDEMVVRSMGPGVKLEDYLNYMATYYLGMSYYSDSCDQIAPTDAEIEAYFEKNKDSYGDIDMNEKYVDVRHVLLRPEGGETGEDGYPVFTDEAWAACLQKAEDIYNKWQEGDKSEESFAVLANENTDDNNDTNLDGQPDGGLYEGVYQGRMVPEFDAWCFDESRQIGDHDLVKTVYGYHIMFFCGSEKVWYTTAKNDLISERAYEMLETAMEKHTATVDFSTMVLGEVDFS